MASEVLAVPEENLNEVISVIRAGLKVAHNISKETRRQLRSWCDSEAKYLQRLREDDNE